MGKKIIICGPRPKSEMTGVALAVELLVDGLRKAQVSFIAVDTTFFNRSGKSGTFSGLRAIETLLVIIRVWFTLPFCHVYYATMSTSIFGFVRDFCTVSAAKLLGRRTVLHLHGGGFEDFYTGQAPLVQKLVRFNLRHVDSIIVLGELLKNQFYCAGDFVKPKLRVVPNGLTLGVEEPMPMERELPTERQIELLYMSSLMPSKGFLDVIQAVALLNAGEERHYHLHLCGAFVDASTEVDREVSDEKELTNYLKKLKIKDAVTYYGQVTGVAKMERFGHASVFLLPTSYPWEGQPLSIIEAEAFSIPVVSCYHRGIPEQVVDGESGRLVPPHNPQAIADAVNDICATTTGYQKYSRAARMQYERNFRRDVHLARLCQAIGLD